MTLPRLNRATTPLACLFALLALAAPGAADSGALASVSYGQRTDAFRRLLFEFQFKPLKRFDELEMNPSESLLIVLGDPRCLSRSTFPQGLRSFVERGGAVLIATDRETVGEAGDILDQLAGVTVTGETLICRNPNPKVLYDGSEYCPFVEPLADALAPNRSTNILGVLATVVGVGSRPALFRNPHPTEPDLRVATNAPSRLRRNARGWWWPSGIYRLAELPNECEIERRMMFRPASQEHLLFAVGGSVGKGRVLVLADHSVFINRMVLPRDNGNLEFAANCLHWLRGGVSTPTEALRAINGPQTLEQLTGQRNKVLFWDDGLIRTDLEVPLKRVPLKSALPPEPVIVAALDKTLANLEDDDYFNRKLLENMEDASGGRQSLLRNVVYLLTLAAALLLGYRFLWRVRYTTSSGERGASASCWKKQNKQAADAPRSPVE